MYKFIKREAIYITFLVQSLISENVLEFLLFFLKCEIHAGHIETLKRFYRAHTINQ